MWTERERGGKRSGAGRKSGGAERLAGVAEKYVAGAKCGAGGRGARSGGYRNRMERGADFSPLTCSAIAMIHTVVA